MFYDIWYHHLILKFLIIDYIYINDFKNLLSSIDNVRDAATSVEDVAKNIASVQKAKKQLRQMILDLRKDHTDIGNQLNELRLQVTNKNWKQNVWM